MSLVMEVEERVRFHKGFKTVKRARLFNKIKPRKWEFNRAPKIDWIINRKQYI